MLTLAIDTATETLSLALAGGEVLLAELEVVAGREHLELLLPSIQNMLSGQGVSFGDLDRIVVGIGPGTFSGLRVGVATARGLAQALRIPISGASTLEALAHGVAAGGGLDEGFVLPVIDAKRGQVFTRMFALGGQGSMRSRSGIQCLDPPELETFASRLSGGTVLAGGNGAQAYHVSLSGCKSLELLPAEDSHNRVRAFHLLETVAFRSAVEKTKAPDAREQDTPGLESMAEVVPVYVREPDADKSVLLRKREPWQE